MNHNAKLATLTVLSLVCALLGACGGGDAEAPPDKVASVPAPAASAPDTTPPTVTIANDVSAPVATGPVTFTFVFSKDVGVSFDTKDVVVTGGTPSAFMRASGSQATVVVTPTPNTKGTITVSVAAGSFNDILLHPNTVGATATKDFDTTVPAGGGGSGGGGGAAIVTFDEATPPKLTDFGTNGAPPVIANDPAGGTNKVLKVFKYKLPAPGSEQWAGVTVSTGANDTIPPIPFAANAKTMTLRVFSPAAGVRVRLKVENAASLGTVSCETDAITTTSGAWETLSFNFANPGLNPPLGGGATSPLDLTKAYDKISIFSDFGIGNGGSGPLPADRVYYYDDISFVAAGGSSGGATSPTNAPATVVPSGATVIYSDAAKVTGFDSCPNWGQATVCGGEQTIAGNKLLKYSALNYEGLDWSANPQNVATQSTLHIDVWTPDLTSLKVSIISPGPKESAVTKTLTTGGWNSIDIPLSSYTVQDLTAIIQIKLESSSPGTLFVDNIYFAAGAASCGTTDPTCAPTTAIPAGSTVIYSDAGNVAGFDSCPNWGQATVCGGEQTIAANKVLKYSALNYEGLDWSANPQNVSTKGKLHIDFWTPDLTSVKVSIISPGPKESAFTQTLTTKGWNAVDIPLASYTVPDLSAIMQIKLESTTPGTLFVDNIYFWGTASSGSSAAVPDMGSGGPVTIPVASAGDKFGFMLSGDAIFANDYIGPVDGLGNHALFAGATTTGTASGGVIGYFNDPLLSTSSQKIEEGGWVSGSIDQQGVPNFFRYFVLTAPGSTFASSYMGLFANAPGNGTVDVSSYASLKFLLWGPAAMYEQGNFNPTIEVVLAGPKVAGCVATGSGGTEITQTFTASKKIGAASAYKLAMSGFTVKGLCGTDTNANAVANVKAKLARLVVVVPASSFNFTNANAGTPVTYSTGVNIGPIGFTNQ